MKAIIPAAGEGKRMLPLTMLYAAGKPLLEHIIDSFPPEVTELIIVVGYKREVIIDHFGDSCLGRKITYVVQEKKTGTADALLLCQSYLEEGERFLLSWADDFYDAETVAKCLDHEYSLLVVEAKDPRRYGVIEVDSEGVVVGIEEKPKEPKSNLIAPGIYILDTNIFKYQPRIIQGEKHFIPMLEGFIKDHKVNTEKANFWVTIGYPEDLEAAEQKMK